MINEKGINFLKPIKHLFCFVTVVDLKGFNFRSLVKEKKTLATTYTDGYINVASFLGNHKNLITKSNRIVYMHSDLVKKYKYNFFFLRWINKIYKKYQNQLLLSVKFKRLIKSNIYEINFAVPKTLMAQSIYGTQTIITYYIINY